jgi:hypothetical protein
MKFSTWLTTFCMLVAVRCVFTTNELREAWKNGKTPQEVATANDALVAEYHEVYGSEADELMAA